MSADPTRCSSGGEEDDSISHQLNVVLERAQLLIGEIAVARVELQPGSRSDWLEPPSRLQRSNSAYGLSCLRSMGNFASVPDMVVAVRGEKATVHDRRKPGDIGQRSQSPSPTRAIYIIFPEADRSYRCLFLPRSRPSANAQTHSPESSCLTLSGRLQNLSSLLTP